VTYTWAVPSGWGAITGQGSNSITVTAGSTGGEITVTPSNSCGEGTAQTLAVSAGVEITSATLTPSGSLNKITGDEATVFTAQANNGSTDNLQYEFYVNGVSVQAKSATATFSYTTPATWGTYRVKAKVYNTCTPSGRETAETVVTVLPNPTSMSDGTGTLSGLTLFDIAESNLDADCGVLSARTANKTDFTTLGAVSYTFTATTANVSNVGYVIQDAEGCVASTTALTGMLESGTLSNGNSVTLNVNYKTTLNSETSTPKIYGRTRTQAAVVTINFIYNNGSIDMKVPLKVSIQDCLTCGAYTAPGVFKVFMCHNLGADENADPFTPAAAIHGAKYKYGTGQVALTQVEDQAESGIISDWESRGGTPPETNTDWDMTTANPCPSGYRVPTRLEWGYVLNNNTITKPGTWINNAANYSSGMKVGNSLFLPAAGYRDGSDGGLAYRGSYGYYWSSNTFFLTFFSSNQRFNSSYSTLGFPVRCVEE
jgi:hypothetical protein